MLRVLYEYSLYLINNDSISNIIKVSLIAKQIKIQLKFYLKRKKLHIKASNLYTLAKNISELGCNYSLLKSITDKKNTIQKPKIYGIDNYKYEVLKGNSFDVSIYFLENCNIFSKTSSIIFNRKLFNNYLNHIEPKYDFKNGLGQYITSFKNKEVILYRKVKYEQLNDEYIYIHLLHEHSGNYFHWLYEVMPKFILICESIKSNGEFCNKKIKILIDDLLPKQFLEIISIYSSIKLDYEIVKPNTFLKVKSLVYCTDLWLSLDNTMFVPNIVKEFFVDKQAVELIKNNLKVSKKSIKPFRKVYLERSKNQARFIENNEEIRTYLIAQGFECIKPEKFSFKEQVEIFNESEIVIGTSGAVFSNLTFMQKNTCAIIFSPNTIASNYYIFQQMADISGVELIHLLTDNSLSDSIHKSSTVNFEDLKKILNSLNGEHFD